MLLRFGLRLDGWMTPSHCVNLAKAADQCGFDALWFAENPYGRGVLPAVCASALATSRIEVGIGVFNPFNRHPTLIAMEMAALDELANGRANLGIGAGMSRVLKMVGLQSDKPIAAMRDTINIVRGLMAGENVVYEGKVFSAKGVKLEFEVPRKVFPIHMAAMGDQAIQLVGELADALMVSNFCTPGFSRRAVEMMQGVAAKRSLPKPPKVVQYAPCVTGPDRNAARSQAKVFVAGMIQRSFSPASTSQSRNWHIIGSDLPEEYYLELYRRLVDGEAAETVINDTVLDLYAVAGNADDCIAAYQRYAAAGVNEMVITFRGADPVAEMAYFSETLKVLRSDSALQKAAS